MLSEIQRRLWETYLRTEQRAPRAEKLRALDAFLDSLAISPTGEWFPWARSIAEQVVDQGDKLIIRRPLFERAVFPALISGYHSRLPGCARWLAGLAQNLYRCPGCCEQLQPEAQTELGLLLAAIRHDAADRRAKERLIRVRADRLRYSLHELPAGVLYGIDGATADQCRELEEELEEFCRLLTSEELEQKYADLIDACRFHFRMYRNHLLNRQNCSTYAEFLSSEQAGSGDYRTGERNEVGQ
jgi:hypothetical protein